MKIRAVKRGETSGAFSILSAVLSVIFPILIGGFFIFLMGINPVEAYISIVSESLGSLYGISETLVKTTPLIFCGLGVAVAFRMQLWNIGAEGQLYMGAFGASLVALFLKTESQFIMISMMFVSAVFFGGVWGLIPGILRAFLNVNETIVTLLMNYIAILWVDFLVYGPWKDPKGFNFPISEKFPDVAAMGGFLDTRLNFSFVIAILIAFSVYLLIEKTVLGYEIKVIGSNPKAALYAGMNIKKEVMLVMFISGGICALAGFGEVAGIQHRLQHAVSPGYGYTAIIVAWLARRSAIGVLIVSFIMGIIFVGGDSLQISYQLPVAMVSVFQGLILFTVIVSEFFRQHKIVVVN